jgi:thiosulfate/3-mercaptopyruvate sulfurtransferase
MSEISAFVVSPQWVAARLGSRSLVIIDASWYLPAQNRDARGEFLAGHIPGAVFFDQDAIVEPGSALPHTLPSPAFFADKVGRLGISEKDTVVVYDGVGLFSAPRVWWMMRIMGARDVYVLDGGLPAWRAAGLPVAAGEADPVPAAFVPSFDAARVVTFEAMRHVVEERSAVVADARPAERFRGEAPEPRPGVRGGHMPGARSVPAAALSRNGALLPAQELRAIFERAGVDLSRPVVTSCGSGVTAAVVTLALETIGHRDNALYDGSWAEWGGSSDAPVVVGEA